MELVDFLRARLDEDDAAARRVPGDLGQSWCDPGPWVMVGDGGGGKEAEVARVVDHIEMPIAEAIAHHIARHDPARVLAEVAAKREIVEQHLPVGDGTVCLSYCHTRTPGDGQAWPCLTLRLLALPYVDHPEYREEWKPQQLYRAGRPGVIDYRRHVGNNQTAQEEAAELYGGACLATFREDPMPDTVYCQERGKHSRHTAWESSNYYAWLDSDEGAGWDPLQ